MFAQSWKRKKLVLLAKSGCFCPDYAIHVLSRQIYLALRWEADASVSGQSGPSRPEMAMSDSTHNENIALYRRLISESAAPRDQGRHATLLKLLADEIAKRPLPQSSKQLDS